METEFRLYRDRPFGCPEFWRAMTIIWNHFRLCDCVANYWEWEGTEKELPFEVTCALRLFSCWLGVIEQEEWEREKS